MTIDEFIAKIPKGGWELTTGGMIRCFSKFQPKCPITAVAGHGHISNAEQIGVEIGLTALSAASIVWAADGDGYPGLRARLLAACNLKEPA